MASFEELTELNPLDETLLNPGAEDTPLELKSTNCDQSDLNASTSDFFTHDRTYIDDVYESVAQQGLCRQTDPELFFPENGKTKKDAKRMCASCEIAEICLRYALEKHDTFGEFGVWGGSSRAQRERINQLDGAGREAAIVEFLADLSEYDVRSPQQKTYEDIISQLPYGLPDISTVQSPIKTEDSVLPQPLSSYPSDMPPVIIVENIEENYFDSEIGKKHIAMVETWFPSLSNSNDGPTSQQKILIAKSLLGGKNTVLSQAVKYGYKPHVIRYIKRVVKENLSNYPDDVQESFLEQLKTT